MMRLSIGYPQKEQEMLIARYMLEGREVEKAEPVCSVEDILNLRKEVAKVTVSEPVLSYIVDIIRATREEERYVLGASPRAMTALIKASMARAYMNGRDYVKPDDVKQVAKPVLVHRFNLTTQAKGQRMDAQGIFDGILMRVKVPV